MQWLLGGALGLVAGAGGMGLLLWWEARKHGAAKESLARLGAEKARLEAALDDCEDNLDRQTGRAATLAKLIVRKETRIRDLETQLAALDPGSLLDSVFDGLPPGAPAGKAGAADGVPD